MTTPAAPMHVPPLPSDALLVRIEALAVELARLAGAEIVSALEREITVEYKQEGRAGGAPSDPVSDVDRAVEALLRARLAETFPDHGIIGEELDAHPLPDQEFVWVVDPVDGTTNFVNGFPLFAAAVGVLHHGRPVVGAIWCSTSHELQAGVYHARHGGALHFEQHPARVIPQRSGIRRALAAAPGGAPARMPHWDHRTTGSAAIECAFVAAGIFTSAIFWSPSIWDIGAGAVLIRAAGLEAWTRRDRQWAPLERFEPPATVREPRAPTLRDWRQPLMFGRADALAELRQTAGRRRLRARLLRMLHIS